MADVEWRSLSGYAGYEIGSNGRVRSKHGRLLGEEWHELDIADNGDFSIRHNGKRVNLNLLIAYRGAFDRPLVPCKGTECATINNCCRCGHNPPVAAARKERIRNGGLVKIDGLKKLILTETGR